MRKAKSKDYRLFQIRDNKAVDPEGHKIIKFILNLPLLPANKIHEGILVIEELIEKSFPDNERKKKTWKKFLNHYFVNEWIEKVTPEVFSVYNMVDRTNNYLESYHRTLNSMIRSKPCPYIFLCK